MLTDLGALGLALFAGRMAAKRATPKMTYGFYRLEILSALLNGAALLSIAFFIVREAFNRLQNPPEVETPVMLAVAGVGFLFNLSAALFLSRFQHQDMNLRGAFFHVMSDTLSSVGTLIAGFVILSTGWKYADPLVTCFIAVLIVAGAWRLLRDVVEVLLEAVPGHINITKLENSFLSVSGVLAIHDLHVWSITSGRESLSAHLEISAGCDSNELLRELNEILSRDFGIHHTTLQLESAGANPCPAEKPKEGKHLH